MVIWTCSAWHRIKSATQNDHTRRTCSLVDAELQRHTTSSHSCIKSIILWRDLVAENIQGVQGTTSPQFPSLMRIFYYI